MRFKISKNDFSLMSKFIKESNCYEIELEPVIETASQAMYEHSLKEKTFHEGFHQGFKEGFYEGRKSENRYCTCGCGGNNCYLRFCDKDCPLYNK